MAKRRRLNRELVVARTAVLADAAGRVEAVTLTALAADLGVRVPSLYNHIAGLEDLRQALAAYGLRQLLDQLRAAAAGHTGRPALQRIAAAYRRFAREHPALYPLTVRAPEPAEAELVALAEELVQMLLLLLASLGLAGAEALHALRGLRALLHGFAALEAAGGFKIALDLDESFDRLLASYLAGVTLAPAHG